MPPFLDSMIEFISSPTFSTLQIVVLSYLGLLWLAIIIWVTRDSINRSSSLIFQTFAIIINIAVPILGVLLYLIIRPGKNNMERYYEDLEHRMLMEGSEEKSTTCEKCLNVVDKDYTFCPNCGAKTKKLCTKCKDHSLLSFNFCPYCGMEQKGKTNAKSSATKKKVKK